MLPCRSRSRHAAQATWRLITSMERANAWGGANFGRNLKYKVPRNASHEKTNGVTSPSSLSCQCSQQLLPLVRSCLRHGLSKSSSPFTGVETAPPYRRLFNNPQRTANAKDPILLLLRHRPGRKSSYRTVPDAAAANRTYQNRISRELCSPARLGYFIINHHYRIHINSSAFNKRFHLPTVVPGVQGYM